MDDIVRQAMAKWPNVPDCYGWLGLDARGNWYLRDAATQAAGAFPASKGAKVEHEKLLAFIARNYECDARGCWFFQNGPQRVYVELEVTPWIWRIHAEGQVYAHTGKAFVPTTCWQDEAGRVYLSDSQTLGLVHTQDVGQLALLLEQGRWPLHETSFEQLCTQFPVELSPQAIFGTPN